MTGRARRTRPSILAAEGEAEPELRWCPRCEQPRDKDDFALCRKMGRQRYCRSCNAANMRSHRAKRAGAARSAAEPEDASSDVADHFARLAAKYRDG